MYKVLVADDDEDVLAIHEELLGDHGYKVVLARDGLEALEKVTSESPDLILLDVMMPNLDGLGVNRKLKENPETADIPVIIVSAYAHFREDFEDNNYPVAAFLEKPFSIEDFLKIVAGVLENKKK